MGLCCDASSDSEHKGCCSPVTVFLGKQRLCETTVTPLLLGARSCRVQLGMLGGS